MGQRPAEALQTRSSALLNRLVEHDTAVVGTPARAVSGNGICGSTTFSTPFQTCAQVVQTRGGSCRHIASGGNSGEVPVVAAAAYHGDQRHRHTGEAHECEHRLRKPRSRPWAPLHQAYAHRQPARRPRPSPGPWTGCAARGKAAGDHAANRPRGRGEAKFRRLEQQFGRAAPVTSVGVKASTAVVGATIAFCTSPLSSPVPAIHMGRSDSCGPTLRAAARRKPP